MSNKHKFVEVSANILEFVNSYLSLHGIDYFEHARIYNDGRSLRITNSPIITEYFLERKFALPDPAIYPKDGIFVWSSIEGLEDFDAQNVDLRFKFNIGDGICFTSVKPNYLEIFDFAGPTGNIGVVNYCLNNIETVKDFCQQYLERFAKIFDDIEPYLITLPLRPKGFIGSKQKFKDFSTITLRQLECIELLANGYTAKMSARILGLSSRTVERHIENIKDKLNVNHRAELISRFLEWKHQVNHHKDFFAAEMC